MNYNEDHDQKGGFWDIAVFKYLLESSLGFDELMNQK
jgi:hypothetical protein